jgi:hypothetical protein
MYWDAGWGYNTKEVALTEDDTELAPRVLTTMVTRVKRWERIAGKTAARCGPPSTDHYYLPRMFAEVFAAICPAARHG